MADLILEDGAMLNPGANTYVLATDVDDWQGARNSGVWPPPPDGADDPNQAAKEAAILKATDYLNGLNWKGQRAGPGRILAWPRREVEDGDGFVIPANMIPQAVKSAVCYLAAFVYAGTDLQPILERGGRIQSRSIGKMSRSFFPDAANRDIAAGIADLLKGLAYGLDAFAGTGADQSGLSMTTISLVQG